MTNNEIIHAVCVLNEEAAAELDAAFYGLTFECDGIGAYVKFLGTYIWSEDDDERAYDETTDTREPLITFLRRRLNEEVTKLVRVRDCWCDNVVLESVDDVAAQPMGASGRVNSCRDLRKIQSQADSHLLESATPEPSKPAVPRLIPSDVSRNFEGTFGWVELEEAAARIVAFCAEHGDSFDSLFYPSSMQTPNESDGFAALVAQGYLWQPDLAGRGGPCLFCVTDQFINRLRVKDTKNQ